MKKVFSLKAIIVTSLIICSPLSFAGTLTPKDAAIVSKINANFAADATTSMLSVNVTSHGGIVDLSGKVSTDTEADKLIQIAEATPGVKDVNTPDLSVKESKHAMSDIAITAKVKGIYMRQKLFGDKDISMMGVSVETTNGVVYLTGTVDTQAEANNAIKYAKSIKGVSDVQSTLTVKPTS